MSTWTDYSARYLCVPGGSVRVLEPARKVDCTLMERRSTVDLYVVMDNEDVWCMYKPCAHGYTEATLIHPLLDDDVDDEATADEAVAVEIEV